MDMDHYCGVRYMRENNCGEWVVSVDCRRSLEFAQELHRICISFGAICKVSHRICLRFCTRFAYDWLERGRTSGCVSGCKV